MKILKEEIKEELIEGFATQPFRDWHTETYLMKKGKKAIEEARNKNLEHIDYLTDQIFFLILKKLIL